MNGKIVHVTTTLDTGGAEMMLYRLLAARTDDDLEPVVVSLSDCGPIGEMIRGLRVPVHTLGMRPGWPSPLAFARLVALLRRERPVLVQTWLYHADLFGGLAARVVGGIPVAWGLHVGTLDPTLMRRSTLQVVQLCARLSRWLPAAIVACAEEARRVHVAFGYDPEKMVVIPNGFDTEALRPDPAARVSVRAELGLPLETPLVGLVARFHPQKDHRMFARAAEHLRWRWHRDDVHFVLCGRGATWDNPELAQWLDEANVRDRCHLLGDRRDVARLQASLDLACLSSAGGEAFPLVLGEAMACGVPCVATDVADTRLLVGEAGRIVPPRDPVALAAAMAEVLDLQETERARLGKIARRRIESCYALPRIVERYGALHADIVTRTRLGTLSSVA